MFPQQIAVPLPRLPPELKPTLASALICKSRHSAPRFRIPTAHSKSLQPFPIFEAMPTKTGLLTSIEPRLGGELGHNPIAALIALRERGEYPVP